MKFNNQPLHSDMMIKVCGMREPKNIALVSALTPMLMGFIFYEKSPRYAGDLPIDAVMSLPPFVTPVALFVDEKIEKIVDICKKYRIDTVQLHGNESPQTCQQLADKGFTVFKAFALSSHRDFAKIKEYEKSVTLFLFDSKPKEGIPGGTGTQWDWSILDDYPLSTPYMLSGGIGPDDVNKIVANMRPGMVGIDINSRFEDAPGLKNIRLLIHFILSLRKFNEHEPSRIPFWKETK